MATCSEAIYAANRYFTNLYILFKINNYREFEINSDNFQACIQIG
jgi:hypothetical protein